MIDVKEVASLLNVPENKIYRWIGKKEIPCYKIGQSYRFNRVDLLEWATENKIPVSPAIFEENVDDADPMPSLIDALRAGGIHYTVAGNDKTGVIRSIVNIIPLPAEVNKTLLADALLARENMGTTAIGDGIAIPHVRNPIIFHVDSPVLALCFLKNAVEFGALDHKPVDTVLTIISSSVRSHLHVLSRLSFALHKPEVRRVINGSSGSDVIFSTLASLEATLDKKEGEVGS